MWKRQDLFERFTSRLIIDGNKIELLPLLVEELVAIPGRLLEFIFEKGFKIYIPIAGDELFFIRNQLGRKEVITYGRESLETSHVLYNKKAIVIIGDKTGFIKYNHPHSVSIHEVAHVVDYALGFAKRPGVYLHQELPKGKALDWYAATNPVEEFAVALEAFCHPELFRNKDYRAHNKLELFKKSPEVFKYFEQLFKDWQ